MKNLTTILVALVLLTSCHDDHNHDIVFPCADVRLNVDASTKSNVNRDDIPATVESIDVVAQSLITPIVREESYTLVDDGSGEDGFIINQVALGLSDFTATTNTIASPVFDVSRFNTNNTSEEDKLAENKLNVPYAVYNGESLEEDITGVNDYVTIPMSTLNGRINTVIKMDESIRNDYTMELLVYTFNNAPVIKSATGNKSLSVYWSADDSLEGQIITYQLKLIADNGAVVYETTETQEVLASTGINTLYTVYADNVQAESVGFNFVFQEWTEIDGNN